MMSILPAGKKRNPGGKEAGEGVKRIYGLVLAAVMAAALPACAASRGAVEQAVPTPEPTAAIEAEGEEIDMIVTIGGVPVTVAWEDNEAARALLALAREGLTIPMSMYGGFEQVGPIGESLPRDDRQITTSPGDLVLYSGDQLVVFYGSNRWAYTPLGHVTDKTAEEMRELLSHGDIEIIIKEGE